MLNVVIQRAAMVVTLLIGIMAASVQASERTAHQVVEETTKDLLSLITDAKGYFDTDEARFYSELETLLEPFVDFNGFSRAVMGRHASRDRMASLAGAEREKLEGQVVRFRDAFKQGLVHTYGKGLLAFNGERIEVLPATPEDAGKTKVTVRQFIFGDREKPYEVRYAMRFREGQGWKLANVILEGINLGKVYRNQFDNAAKLYELDLDKVIDTWSVTPSS